MPREIVTLQCSDCKERNYSTTKNRKTTTERLEFKKFCPRCRAHIAPVAGIDQDKTGFQGLAQKVTR